MCTGMNETIEHCVNALVSSQDMGSSVTTLTPKQIDLVLEGGLFNGSYLIGILYYLKALERTNQLRVNKISGCSIGALFGLLYLLDKLHLGEELYKEITTTKNLQLLTEEGELYSRIFGGVAATTEANKQTLLLVQDRLFITHYNCRMVKKITTSTYDSLENVVETVIKSCYIPLIIDGNLTYKNKYIDGMTPHIFPADAQTGASVSTDTLYIQLVSSSLSSWAQAISVKGEVTNYHRILQGIADVHLFFLRNGENPTKHCSYVSQWIPQYHTFLWGLHIIEQLFALCVFVLLWIIETSCNYAAAVTRHICHTKQQTLFG